MVFFAEKGNHVQSQVRLFPSAEALPSSGEERYPVLMRCLWITTQQLLQWANDIGTLLTSTKGGNAVDTPVLLVYEQRRIQISRT